MDTNRATQNLVKGYVWAESVLLAVCQEFDFEIDNKVIPRIAFGFAGGIGNTGAVYGAVAGAVMAISLIIDRGDTMEEAIGTLEVVKEFRQLFENEMGTISCRELTGIDLSTEEGVSQLMGSDTPQTVCIPAVGVAYQLVVDLLNKTS